MKSAFFRFFFSCHFYALYVVKIEKTIKKKTVLSCFWPFLDKIRVSWHIMIKLSNLLFQGHIFSKVRLPYIPFKVWNTGNDNLPYFIIYGKLGTINLKLKLWVFFYHFYVFLIHQLLPYFSYFTIFFTIFYPIFTIFYKFFYHILLYFLPYITIFFTIFYQNTVINFYHIFNHFFVNFFPYFLLFCSGYVSSH